VGVDRGAWLAERRRVAEERFDTIFAPTYDEQDIAITRTHARFVSALLERCPAGGRILDAACGTGKYFGMVLESGREVLGIDQSAGMLAVANAKYPGVETKKVGLQEMDFEAAFDGAMCVDAMENVFPEDWPRVLGNLRRAVRPGGPIYFTVETIDRSEVERVFAEARDQGLPVELGEHYIRGGGYHFYPSTEQVEGWIAGAGLTVLERGRNEGGNYGYDHLMCASG
jgi:SAM-dependent methyltransferase